MDKPWTNDSERADYWEKAYWDYLLHRNYGHDDYSSVAKKRILRKITEIRQREREVQYRSMIDIIHRLKDYNNTLQERNEELEFYLSCVHTTGETLFVDVKNMRKMWNFLKVLNNPHALRNSRYLRYPYER